MNQCPYTLPTPLVLPFKEATHYRTNTPRKCKKKRKNQLQFFGGRLLDPHSISRELYTSRNRYQLKINKAEVLRPKREIIGPSKNWRNIQEKNQNTEMPYPSLLLWATLSKGRENPFAMKIRISFFREYHLAEFHKSRWLRSSLWSCD